MLIHPVNAAVNRNHPRSSECTGTSYMPNNSCSKSSMCTSCIMLNPELPSLSTLSAFPICCLKSSSDCNPSSQSTFTPKNADIQRCFVQHSITNNNNNCYSPLPSLRCTDDSSVAVDQRLFTPLSTFDLSRVCNDKYTSRPCHQNNLSTYYHSAMIEPKTTLNKSVVDPYYQCSYLNYLSSLQIPPVFPAARNALYTRYTPKDWYNFERLQYEVVDKTLIVSKKLAEESERLAQEYDEQAWKDQFDSTKEISCVIQEVNFWKNELKKLCKKLINKINELILKRADIERGLDDLLPRIKIIQENLYEREKRQNIDLVHDNVERELLKLHDILIDAQKSADSGMFKKLDVQIAMNRATLDELELDANDKFRALILENAAHNLINTSPQIYFYQGTDNTVKSDLCYFDWLKRIKENIKRARCEIIQSDELLRTQTNILRMEQDIFNQWETVGSALEQRIQEIKDARNRLQDRFDCILHEIYNTGKTIKFLKKSIQDKETYTKVTQTRMSLLSMRPVSENINDREYPKLLRELNDLQCTVNKLKQQQCQEENTLQYLLSLKATIENDLAIKSNSLYIDEHKVVGLRRTFPPSSSSKPTLQNVPCIYSGSAKHLYNTLSDRYQQHSTLDHINRSDPIHFLCES
ncbi:unnamed protein product [Didymodactylos carnosus]|uniref:Tektin n=1 Tax=Didymodactylos carnosus TaxID=1234261 RepID=A0A813VGM6_9BILA|nr:unnamed protein product [Didymodactylos carnosus]CAF3625462.1 unnamed protein product [Didymodactylos carnosus]